MDEITKETEARDRRYGLRVNEIESLLLSHARSLRPEGTQQNLGPALHHGHQTWIGLEFQAFLTPYSELELMIRELAPKRGEKLVDLGAGYGRMGLVMHELCPEALFEGHELVPERVREGQRVFETLSCENARLFVSDLSAPEFVVPEAEYYFIFDFGKLEFIRKILGDLSRIADRRSFRLVARGKGTRSLIDHGHPWLSPVFRHENFTIYSI